MYQSRLRGGVGPVSPVLFALVLGAAAPAAAQTRTYTTNADFAEGSLVDVNFDPPNRDQLQIDDGGEFSLLSVACGGLDTVVRIRTDTGEVVGEYLTAPGSLDGDPSRATTDLVGNVWVGNRLEDGDGATGFGSVTQVGVVIGGTRTDANGVPTPNGQYLAPPYTYSTVVDRDGDGLIRTSNGLGDVLAWPDVTDGLGGNPALVEDSEDEALRIFQRTQPIRVRHISVDPATNDLWAGGYPTFPTSFDQLDGTNGAVLSNLAAVPPGCGGYAGLVSSAGVLWSTSELEGQLFRKDLGSAAAATCVNVQTNVRGIAEAADGTLWTAGGNVLVQVSADGTQTTTFGPAGALQLHGIAIDPASGDLWVASSGSSEVLRLDSAGTLITRITAGTQPRGLAFDGAGKLWVANQGSDDVMRIDPATNAVDLTVALRAGASPYNPSDMTGTITYNDAVFQGTWSVVADGGATGTTWTDVSWMEGLVGDGRIDVSVRAANSQGALAGLPFTAVGNGTGIAQTGRFLEVQALFLRSTVAAKESPILFDLTVTGENEMMDEDCPMAHRRRAGSLLVYPEFDNESGSQTLLTLTHSQPDGGDIAVEFVYIDGEGCTEFNRTELLTPNDTLTLLTRVHNPDQDRGYVYAFAKDALTGEPIVSNVLIGHSLIVSAGIGGGRSAGKGRGGNSGGLGAIEYSVNPLVFEGLAEGGFTDVDGDGLRDLDGVEYEMGPDELLIPRFFGQGDVDTFGVSAFDSSLVLLSLSGGAQFDTTVDFLVYNDNEEVFSAEHTFYCWEKVALLDISAVFGQSFLANGTAHDPGELLGAPEIETGWMRIDGAVANSSSTAIHDPAVYAVLIERIGSLGGADAPFELCTQPGGVLLPRDLSGGQ